MNRTRGVGSFVVVAMTLAFFGCGADSSGKAEIYAFRARVTTGAEGSDGDVALCWTALGAEECSELVSDDDDWQARSARTYDVRPKARIPESAPLSSIRLKYTAPLLVGRDEWALEGVTVTAYLANETSRIVCEARDIGRVLTPNQTFDCPPSP